METFCGGEGHSCIAITSSTSSSSYTQDVVDYDDDHNLDEVFRMYGVKAALDNSNSNVDDDCQSEASDDLAERLNSRLLVVRASASSGKILAQFPMDEADTIVTHVVDRNRGSRIRVSYLGRCFSQCRKIRCRLEMNCSFENAFFSLQ